jgi:hypothetical protein
MKSSLNARSMYDRVFSKVAIIAACVIIVDACYTIFVQIGVVIMTFIKVWKLSLMIRISIHHWMW